MERVVGMAWQLPLHDELRNHFADTIVVGDYSSSQGLLDLLLRALGLGNCHLQYIMVSYS